MRHTKKMMQFITIIVARKKKIVTHNYEDFESYFFADSRQFSFEVAEKFELFWQNNELGYDKNGKLIRTDKPRKKPKPDFDYRNKNNKKLWNT